MDIIDVLMKKGQLGHEKLLKNELFTPPSYFFEEKKGISTIFG